MELLLIRHALPERVENASGAADPVLAARGREQAERLAEYLASERIDAIYASPMRRAQETAQPLAKRLEIEVITDPRLAEYDRDAPTYIPIEELKATDYDAWLSVMNGDWQGTMDPEQFRRNVLDGVASIIAAHPGRVVAAVCHGGVINQYLSDVLAIAPSAGFFYPVYTSIHRVRAASTGQRSVMTMNEAAHLRGTGLLD
jgi:2,3-bisphosphoglycerate-dependent phosphoglycerate mutase